MNRVILRNGTSSEWTTYDPVLLEGEVGLELDTGRVKIGDGIRSWQQLKYTIDEAIAQSIVNAIIFG